MFYMLVLFGATLVCPLMAMEEPGKKAPLKFDAEKWIVARDVISRDNEDTPPPPLIRAGKVGLPRQNSLGSLINSIEAKSLIPPKSKSDDRIGEAHAGKSHDKTKKEKKPLSKKQKKKDARLRLEKAPNTIVLSREEVRKQQLLNTRAKSARTINEAKGDVHFDKRTFNKERQLASSSETIPSPSTQEHTHTEQRRKFSFPLFFSRKELPKVVGSSLTERKKQYEESFHNPCNIDDPFAHTEDTFALLAVMNRNQLISALRNSGTFQYEYRYFRGLLKGALGGVIAELDIEDYSFLRYAFNFAAAKKERKEAIDHRFEALMLFSTQPQAYEDQHAYIAFLRRVVLPIVKELPPPIREFFKKMQNMAEPALNPKPVQCA